MPALSVTKSASQLVANIGLAACLTYMGWAWLIQPGKPVLDEVVLEYPLGNGGVIYGVRDNRGGATTGMSYRFYAYQKSAGEEDIKHTLADQSPFLITKDADIGITGNGERVSVSVKDQVYAFSSRTLFKHAQGAGFTPLDIDLIAQTPTRP